MRWKKDGSLREIRNLQAGSELKIGSCETWRSGYLIGCRGSFPIFGGWPDCAHGVIPVDSVCASFGYTAQSGSLHEMPSMVY